MDISKAENIIVNWASKNPAISRVYLYGSRIKGNYEDESDLDIAVELNLTKGAENLLAVWLCDKDNWQDELQALIPYKVHLEWYHENETKLVGSGIKEACRLIYQQHQ